MPALPPKVSVIIPLYNAEPYIAACLESVIAQTHNDFEIILTDDGGTDASVTIVAEYQKLYPEKIFVYAHTHHANRGITASRNLAIRHARGEYLAFLDNDDLWLPEKLAKQVQIMDHHPDVALVYAKAGFIDEQNRPISLGGANTFGDGQPGQPALIFARLLLKNPIPALTVLARRHTLEKAGAFDETMLYNEDRLVWSKMLYEHAAYFIPEVLALYRVHETNFSRALAKQKAHAEAEFQYFHRLIDFLHQHNHTPLPHSAFALALFRFFLRLWLWGTPRRQLLEYSRILFKQSPFLKYRLPLLGLLMGMLMGPRLGITMKRLYQVNWAEYGAPTA